MTPKPWTDLRAELAERRKNACDLADEGKDGNERAFGRIEAYDEIMQWMDRAVAPEFTVGQEVIWTGSQNLFSRRVRITEVRYSYLQLFGETPLDARVVCDIADPVIKGTVYGIPTGQLHAIATEG